MFIDTHCHLFREYYEDILMVLNDCMEKGVCKVIVSGCDMKSNKEVLELVKQYDMVYGTIGFHPTELEDFKLKDLEWLERNASNEKIVGIGEIGLDYHYENTDKEKQQLVFRKQLEIASKMRKPIVVHSRDSIQDTYNILKEYDLRGSIHCFSGSVEMAREFVKRGFFLGIGGIITYKTAKNIKEVVKGIPLSYLLLETDSPYLAPEPYRAASNSPANIPVIAKAIADLKGLEMAEVARVCTSNTVGLFDFLEK